MKDLLIGTPCYNCHLHLEYFNTMMDFWRNGVIFTHVGLGNESLITRARNTILAYAYHNLNKFDHLLFLDADVKIHTGGLENLFMRDVPMVGAPVALKGKDSVGNPLYNIGKTLEDCGNGLIKTNWVGTAVWLMRHETIKILYESAKDRYEHNGMEVADVFQVGVVDGIYLSEDYFVCTELRKLGFDVHVDLTVRTTHYGISSFI